MGIGFSRAYNSLLIRQSPKLIPRVRPLNPVHRSPLRIMTTRPANTDFSRDDLEDLLKRRFFVNRSFDIYGGVAGLYDLGVYPFEYSQKLI